MKEKLFLFAALISSALSFTSCGSDSDYSPADITIPTETDEECCNTEETFLAYTFLNNGYVKEVESLRDTINNQYELRAYTRNGKLNVGYNDVFFALIKLSNGGYVRDFTVTDIKPLMTMTAMNMKHSTPTATEAEVYDKSFPAVRRAWVSFIMASGTNGYWELSYKLTAQAGSITHKPSLLTVDALTNNRSWVKSFKVGNDTYYISLVNPNEFSDVTTDVYAYISKKATDGTQPYLLADEHFTVDLYPTMPDMGNHSSVGNEPLILQPDGSYKGTLNFSMVGLWDIHLNVKDSEGNTVAGGEGLSDLYFTVIVN